MDELAGTDEAWQKGFIAGLEEARLKIIEVKKVIPEFLPIEVNVKDCLCALDFLDGVLTGTIKKQESPK